ncbi:MAG: hypothetical protein ABIB65_06680, partial [Candidatus Margulisiibacteriota bacterium]
NDTGLIPCRNFNGNPGDPYFLPFEGRETIEYKLAGIPAINKLQLVIGDGKDIDMQVHNISLV